MALMMVVSCQLLLLLPEKSPNHHRDGTVLQDFPSPALWSSPEVAHGTTPGPHPRIARHKGDAHPSQSVQSLVPLPGHLHREVLQRRKDHHLEITGLQSIEGLTPDHQDAGLPHTHLPVPLSIGEGLGPSHLGNADAEVQASEGVAHDHLSGGGVPDLLRLIVVALGVGVVMVGGGTLGNRVLSRRKKSHVHLPLSLDPPHLLTLPVNTVPSQR